MVSGREEKGKERESERKKWEKEKTADQEREWSSTDIPPTQTLPVLIFVIFLALGSTVVGRTVSSLMVCTVWLAVVFLEVASRCLSVCPFPPSAVTPACLTYSCFRTFPDSLVCHLFSFCPLQNPLKKQSTQTQLCCLLHLLPSWHPLFAISSKACVWQHAHLYTCKLACTFFAGIHMCVRMQNVCAHIWTYFLRSLWSAENQAAWENHGRTRVWVGPIIKNNPSICRASPGAASAEKHGKKKWKKKCGSYEEGEKNLSLQSLCFGLPTSAGCW